MLGQVPANITSEGGMGPPLQATSTHSEFAALAAGAAKGWRRIEGALGAHLTTRAAAEASEV